jgi:threonine dehydrogenase-like Zn-dependent dehydrogenase
MSRSPREWTLRFMKMDEAETHDQVIAWMRSGKLVAGEFYDLALPMDRVQEAFDRLAARQANKIVLEM